MFTFDRLSDAKLRDVERKCIAVPGVVSVCFQHVENEEMRCIIRCMAVVEDKV